MTRALRTGVNQTALKAQLQLAREMGADLVEVTAHAGARPSHAEWQGGVHSLRGETKGYKLLSDATGYGTGDGLGGWNCRHSFFPHFPGQSSTYSKDELEEYTNSDAVEYNGKKMSLYEAEQYQRKMERTIRRWKREESAMKAAGLETAESSAKVRMWNSRYKDFCSKTGLKQQRERLVERVAKSASSGIMRVDRNAQRKESNIGQFSGLKIPMRKRFVRKIANKYGIDLKGITVKIQRSEKLLALSATGMTDYKCIGRIDLLPNAFLDEEQLVRTLIHELCHVKQLRKYGTKYALNNLETIERVAYRYEDFWYKLITRDGKT